MVCITLGSHRSLVTEIEQNDQVTRDQCIVNMETLDRPLSNKAANGNQRLSTCFRKRSVRKLYDSGYVEQHSNIIICESNL